MAWDSYFKNKGPPFWSNLWPKDQPIAGQGLEQGRMLIFKENTTLFDGLGGWAMVQDAGHNFFFPVLDET